MFHASRACCFSGGTLPAGSTAVRPADRAGLGEAPPQHPSARRRDREQDRAIGPMPRLPTTIGAARSVFRSPEIRARVLDLGSDHAVLDVIVDQPHGLHEGIHRGRSGEFPASFLELVRQRNRLHRDRRCLWSRTAPAIGFVPPHEGSKRALACDKLLRAPRVVDDGLDLSPMANDALVLEQSSDVAPGEARNRIEIEVVEGCTKILALRQDGAPAQSRLKAFQAQFLEQTMIVTDRKASFGIVVAEKLRRGTAPAAAQCSTGPTIVLLICVSMHQGHGAVGHAKMDFSRSSTLDGLISRISARTIPSATNGSAFTLSCRSGIELLCATIP